MNLKNVLKLLAVFSCLRNSRAKHGPQSHVYQLADNNPTLRLRRDVLNDTNKIETNVTHDNHRYYNSTFYRDGRQFFIDLTQPVSKDIVVIIHEKSSASYRKAYKVDLGFDFPFYGNVINYIRVTTGGFINIGPRFHSYIHLVHYIAPLMADFNPSLSNNTSIYIGKSDSMLIVQWNNIMLNGSSNKTEPFTFQVILNKNGTVIMVYKDIPVPLLKIRNTTHNVTVGFSDGFILTYSRRDRKGQLIVHNFIYSYHKVNFPLKTIISGSAYKLVLLPNCIQAKSCTACLNSSMSPFTCQWCSKINLCSDTLDWHRNKWLSNKCQYPGNSFSEVDQCVGTTVRPTATKSHTSTAIIGVVVGVVLFLLFLFVVYLFYYSYTHPQSKAGMWLIEHHPRRMFKKSFDPVSREDLL